MGVTVPPTVRSETSGGEAELVVTSLWAPGWGSNGRITPKSHLSPECYFLTCRMSRVSPEGPPPGPLRPQHEHSGTMTQVCHFSEPQWPL